MRFRWVWCVRRREETAGLWHIIPSVNPVCDRIYNGSLRMSNAVLLMQEQLHRFRPSRTSIPPRLGVCSWVSEALGHSSSVKSSASSRAWAISKPYYRVVGTYASGSISPTDRLTGFHQCRHVVTAYQISNLTSPSTTVDDLPLNR